MADSTLIVDTIRDAHVNRFRDSTVSMCIKFARRLMAVAVQIGADGMSTIHWVGASMLGHGRIQCSKRIQLM